MKPLALFLAVASLAAFGTLVAAEPDETAQPVTVFVVRHAEKAVAKAGNSDPELSTVGLARAQALARLLGKAGVTHLYASEYQRTQHTLRPLGQQMALKTAIVPAGQGGQLTGALRNLAPGSVAVVAGHSNTVPALVKALGGKVDGLEKHARYGPILPDHAYDRLYMVILPKGAGGAVKTIEMRFGKQSPAAVSEARTR